VCVGKAEETIEKGLAGYCGSPFRFDVACSSYIVLRMSYVVLCGGQGPPSSAYYVVFNHKSPQFTTCFVVNAFSPSKTPLFALKFIYLSQKKKNLYVRRLRMALPRSTLNAGKDPWILLSCRTERLKFCATDPLVDFLGQAAPLLRQHPDKQVTLMTTSKVRKHWSCLLIRTFIRTFSLLLP
jgi:hypothetical protein